MHSFLLPLVPFVYEKWTDCEAFMQPSQDHFEIIDIPFIATPDAIPIGRRSSRIVVSLPSRTFSPTTIVVMEQIAPMPQICSLDTASTSQRYCKGSSIPSDE